MFKVDNEETRRSSFNEIVVVSLLLTFDIFHTFSSFSIIDLEQEIAFWKGMDIFAKHAQS